MRCTLTLDAHVEQKGHATTAANALVVAFGARGEYTELSFLVFSDLSQKSHS